MDELIYKGNDRPPKLPAVVKVTFDALNEENVFENMEVYIPPVTVENESNPSIKRKMIPISPFYAITVHSS